MFAEMPLDNRTVDKFAALAAGAGLSHPIWNVTTNDTI
jgi:hypothetical protein